jgi:hypothetical protein
LGLQVEKTLEGATVDRIVSLPESGLTFGLEITGTNGKINKSHRKISQALAFIQQRQGNEKGLLIANTYCDRPLGERTGQEHFTPEATDLLTGLKFVAMTTVDLYNIWKSCKCEGNSARDIFETIHRHPGGVFQFPSE